MGQEERKLPVLEFRSPRAFPFFPAWDQTKPGFGFDLDAGTQAKLNREALKPRRPQGAEGEAVSMAFPQSAITKSENLTKLFNVFILFPF